MPSVSFTFAEPLYFLALLAIPCFFALALFLRKKTALYRSLEPFIDKHLLPYLLHAPSYPATAYWRSLSLFSFAWCCFTFAMAGPRWQMREVETIEKTANLLILLDLSLSMDVQDEKPSRLERAKQKIEDLLHLAQGVKVGLVAFAADPHTIVPLTDDYATIKRLLPSLDTKLPAFQGSVLTPALKLAASLLQGEKGGSHALVIFSDGGFEDTSALSFAKQLANQGIPVHAVGVGTPQGGPAVDERGNSVQQEGKPLILRLEEEKLQELAALGKGKYSRAGFNDAHEAALIAALKSSGDAAIKKEKTILLWKEEFPLFLWAAIPAFLWWFRRQKILFAVFFLMATMSHLQASSFLYNAEQQAFNLYQAGDYEQAAKQFQDPYRQAVSQYRMGNYAEAERLFDASTRKEVEQSSLYNLGNAQAMQGKLHEAIASYEKVLELWPDHQKARENLEIVKKMLQQEPPANNQSGQEEEPSQEESKQDNNPSNEPSENGKPDEPPPPDRSESTSSEGEEDTSSQPEESPDSPSQEELEAGQWLNRLDDDPREFLKRKFAIESKKNKTTGETAPW